MFELKDAWKNKEVFEKQLRYNLTELSDKNSYPLHWNNCIEFVRYFKPKSFLDLGCGCGALSEVLFREFPEMQYTGMDYSEGAIEIANKEWSDRTFHVKDLMELNKSELTDYDVIFASAVFDVMPNGDEALEYLMSVSPTNIILSRPKFVSESSYYKTYIAYDLIETCAYHHNKEKFVELCEKYGYDIVQLNGDLYLEKK